MSIRLTNTQISAAARTICPNILSQNRSNQKENMVINPKCDAIAAWGFSTWFVLLSPAIGILLGLFAAFLSLR